VSEVLREKREISKTTVRVEDGQEKSGRKRDGRAWSEGDCQGGRCETDPKKKILANKGEKVGRREGGDWVCWKNVTGTGGVGRGEGDRTGKASRMLLDVGKGRKAMIEQASAKGFSQMSSTPNGNSRTGKGRGRVGEEKR